MVWNSPFLHFWSSNLNTGSLKPRCRQTELQEKSSGSGSKNRKRKFQWSERARNPLPLFSFVCFVLLLSIFSNLSSNRPHGVWEEPSWSSEKQRLKEENLPLWSEELWFLKCQGNPCCFISLCPLATWS